MVMDEELKKLQERLKVNNEESRELLERAKTENRDPSEEEREQLKVLIDEFDQIKGDIETRNRVLEQEDLLVSAEGNRQTTPEPVDNVSHSEDDKTGAADGPGATKARTGSGTTAERSGRLLPLRRFCVGCAVRISTRRLRRRSFASVACTNDD
jgi:hypothetical protein